MRLKWFLTFIIFFNALTAFPVLAQSPATDAKPIKLNVPIGNVTEININDTSFAAYFQAWYSFIIGSIGVIATVMMMWGGFKWLTSRGNSGDISDAKQIIWSALTGVVLAFLSYSILYFINPATTRIGLPQVISHRVEVDIAEIKLIEQEVHPVDSRHPAPSGGKREGTYNLTTAQKEQMLRDAGIIEATDLANKDSIANINDETIKGMIQLKKDYPNVYFEITSGYRTNSDNHITGSVFDLDDNEGHNDRGIDEAMTSITTGDKYVQYSTVDTETTDAGQTFNMTIYQMKDNPWGITRIIDERTRPGAGHWHVEFRQ